MMCRAQQCKGSAQRPQSVAKPAGQSMRGALQTVAAGVTLYPFAHAQEVCRRHPFAARNRGIRHEVEGASLNVAANQAVQDQPPIFTYKHERPESRIVGLQWADAYGFTIANGRIHARSARAEDHGRVLVQQIFNYFLGIGHGVSGPQSERYRKP